MIARIYQWIHAFHQWGMSLSDQGRTNLFILEMIAATGTMGLIYAFFIFPLEERYKERKRRREENHGN